MLKTIVHWLIAPLARFLFYVVLGWVEKFPEQSMKSKKAVVIMYPHSSYWDGVYSLMWWCANPQLNTTGVFHAEGLPGWAGWLFGMILYHPKKQDFVKHIASELKSSDRILFLAPEGDIKKMKRIRTGFYYIAREAGYPIIALLTDARNRILEASEKFDPSDKTKKQIVDEIGDWYRSRDAKNKAIYPHMITDFTLEEVCEEKCQ